MEKAGESEKKREKQPHVREKASCEHDPKDASSHDAAFGDDACRIKKGIHSDSKRNSCGENVNYPKIRVMKKLGKIPNPKTPNAMVMSARVREKEGAGSSGPSGAVRYMSLMIRK